MLPSVAPTCSAKRTVHTRTVRFFVSNRMCGKAPFLRRVTSPAVPFVSFLLRRKEAKENPLPERCFPVLPSFAPTCSAKRTVHTRTVRFFVSNRMCGKAPFLRRVTSPAVPFVSFLLRRKEAKENPLPKRCFPMLPPLAPTCCAKRTVHTRTVRFFVPNHVRKSAFSP